MGFTKAMLKKSEFFAAMQEIRLFYRILVNHI